MLTPTYWVSMKATGGNMMDNKNHSIVSFTQNASLAMKGVTGLNDALKETSASDNSIEKMATGFKSIGTSVSQFISQLPMFQSNFGNVSTTMKDNIVGVDDSFTKMYVDVQNNGTKMIAWFKSAFIPMFASSYWSEILSGIPIAFTNAFTLAVNNAKQIWMQFAQWANENMKMDVSGQKKDGNSEVRMKFPAYAKGGFPEDGMFFANHSEMVGQFSNGKTAVANNEQITEGIKQGVYEAVVSAMAASGGNGGNVIVELRGDASDIFSAVVKENNRNIMRTGRSQLRV